MNNGRKRIKMSKSARIKPGEDAKTHIQSATDKPGFMERVIDDIKGRGVFATQPLEPGAFVLEYRGELLSIEQRWARHYSEKERAFLYEFEWCNHQWCIDASEEDGSLGRLVNDNQESPNCIMKRITVDNKPHLCLFAVKAINVGDEVDYNYGNSKWPWRDKVVGAHKFSLVDYSDSENSDPEEESINYGSQPGLWDKVVLMNSRMENSLMYKVPQYSSDALYDSSDEGPSMSKAEMASKRPRSFFLNIQNSLVESDAMSEDGEEDRIPNPKEESSDCDSILDLCLDNRTMAKIASAHHGRIRSANRNQCEIIQSKNLGQNYDSIYKDSDESTENEMVALEDPVLYVNPALKKEDGSRKYSKKHRCLYCGLEVQKMSRHLLRKHSEKVEVAKALNLPKNSKERRLQLDLIRNKGNFEHNVEVLENHKGNLIPSKQPSNKTDGQNFLHCLYCYGLFKKRLLWRHFRVCKFRPKEKTPNAGKTRVQALCAFAEPAPSGYSVAYWKFLSNMIQDNIAVAIKKDPCILEYGYRLFLKNEQAVSQHQHIRQKLRELGRLLLEARSVTPVKTLKDLIKPEKYNVIVTAARTLSGFSQETGTYQRPSLARKVGHTLYSLAIFLKSEALTVGDMQAVQDAEEFAQLYQESWKFEFGIQAVAQTDQAKWNSPQILPFTQDVQTLHCHMTEKQKQYLVALNADPSPSAWKDLARVTLAQVILFNRRRPGEVSRMPLCEFLSGGSSETHEDVTLALTALEQKLCNQFTQITIVGERGKKVPVLLTPLMREALDSLTEKRDECGVLKENQYLFALPHSIHYLRGCDCIRQCVNECAGLRHPTALTSTKLRKHVATLSTVLNLKTTDLDQLTDFLGHNVDVHRKHYQLPESALQLAKISKVLLAMEKGQLGNYKGKNLDEIHLDVNETIDMEECLEEEDLEDTSMSEAQSMELMDTITSFPEDVRVPEAPGWDEDVSTAPLQECTFTSIGHIERKLAKMRGKHDVVKRHWAPEECAAVERHLGSFLVMNEVPGKVDCERCIAAEPETLAHRDWKGVKYFIKNRITAIRRKL